MKKDDIKINSKLIQMYFKSICIISIPIMLFSLMIMGSYFRYIFILLMIFNAIVLFFLYVLIYPWTHSKIIKDKQIVTKGFFWKIDINNIKYINVVEIWDLYFVSIHKNIKKKIVLAIATGNEDLEILKRELTNLKEINHTKVKIIYPIIFFILLDVIFYLTAVTWIHSRYEVASIVPKKIISQNFDGFNGTSHSRDAIIFNIPSKYIKLKRTQQSLYFADRDKRILINFGNYDMDYSKFRFFYKRLNIKNSYDMLRMAYYSKYPLYFLNFKSKFIQSYKGMKVYEYAGQKNLSFITEFYDASLKKYKCTLFIYNLKYGKEINVILVGDTPFTQEFWMKMVNSIDVKYVQKENRIENNIKDLMVLEDRKNR